MATSKRIVFTRHDGGVSVCTPTAEIFSIMQCGGYWHDRPAGFVETQIERQIEAGTSPAHATRFAHAVAYGGCSEAEVWGLIRDRDCGHLGTLHELIDASELPNRWFRNAWRRSANGGPVVVDLAKARHLQWGFIASSAKHENERRALRLDCAPVTLETLTLQTAIKAARDEDELAHVWPDGLPIWHTSKAAPKHPRART